MFNVILLITNTNNNKLRSIFVGLVMNNVVLRQKHFRGFWFSSFEIRPMPLMLQARLFIWHGHYTIPTNGTVN